MNPLDVFIAFEFIAKMWTLKSSLKGKASLDQCRCAYHQEKFLMFSQPALSISPT
jgi:hypothetical protein